MHRTTWLTSIICHAVLPRHGRCFERFNGDRLDLDLYDAQVWSDYGLSPVMDGILDPEGPEKDAKRASARHTMSLSKARVWSSSPASVLSAGQLAPTLPVVEEGKETAVDHTSDEDILDYFERTTARVKKFYAEIDAGFSRAKLEAGLYPPVVCIAGENKPTVRGALTKDPANIRRQDKNPYKRFLFGDGDGLVTFDSARALPGAWNELSKGVVTTDFGHVCLLSDMTAVQQAVKLVTE